MPKLDLSLVSEMTWYECVMAATLRETTTLRTWVCADCPTILILDRTKEQIEGGRLVDDIEGDAQIYLDAGWGYTRDAKKFSARCLNCRHKRRKT